MRTVPVLGVENPAHSFSVVDLPAPLWPSSPTTPPSAVNETSASETVSPYQRDTPVNSIAGALIPRPARSAPPAR